MSEHTIADMQVYFKVTFLDAKEFGVRLQGRSVLEVDTESWVEDEW